MHYLYILYSEKVNKYYIGETHNTEERLSKHNEHCYEVSFTRIANDWKVVLIYQCISRNQACSLENFIKKMKSKIFIKKIVANPEIVTEIISKNNF